MLKKLVVIENGKDVQFDTIEEVVKALIDDNYYDMPQNQKTEIMKKKALANCISNGRKVIQETTEEIVNDLEKVFIIKDEITYIFSLLMTNNLLLLESKDSNLFTKGLNKENIKDNYIIVNTFAKELLKNYIINN